MQAAHLLDHASVEETHWWFVGRRKIIESFLKPVCVGLKSKKPRGNRSTFWMLVAAPRKPGNASQFGNAEGVDVSTEALEFCRRRGFAAGETRGG